MKPDYFVTHLHGFKLNDKVLCKKDIETTFTKNNLYTIITLDIRDDTMWITHEPECPNDGAWFCIRKNQINDIFEPYPFYDYFYSPQEIRLIKLKLYD